MLYSSIRVGLNSIGQLMPYNPNIVPTVKNQDVDTYVSLYQYNEEHKSIVEQNNSFKGIRDTSTDRLYFDFDSKDNIELAREDALECIKRLINWGIPEEAIQAFFSGAKGIILEIYLNNRLTPFQFRYATGKVAKGLKTFDPSVSDANRVVRMVNTKHQTSGLYKVYLSLDDLDELTVNDIKLIAQKPGKVPEVIRVDLPKELMIAETETTKNNTEIPTGGIESIWVNKPRNWRNCKWAIAQGYFEEGERHNALTILAATCRGLGFDKEQTYYFCKAALKKQAARTATNEFSKDELWNNIIEASIFTDTWQGGMYTCKTDPWLSKYCEALGPHKCSSATDEYACVSLDKMKDLFINFSENFEKNLIKSGNKELDDNVTFLTSTLVGWIGNPGSGKTSMALNYLRNAAKSGIPSIFFSMDMAIALVYPKLVQHTSNFGFKEVQKIFQTNPVLREELGEKIKKEYHHVSFNFKSGLTVPDIKNIILQEQENHGQKIRFVVIDYLECIAGPYSDPTANSGFVANQLKDLAGELGVCILLLLQTQKHSTSDISEPLTSLKQAKGSSLIEQSCSVMLTLWREGYNPEYAEQDKFISVAVVKNRFGPLWRGDFSWDGTRGTFRSLAEEEKKDLINLKVKKAKAKALTPENTAKKQLSELTQLGSGSADGWE